MSSLNYATYADVFGADLLPRFLALREGEQQLILALVRDRYVAGDPVVPWRYLRRKGMSGDEAARAIVSASSYYDTRKNTYLANAEFVAVVAAVKRRLLHIMASPVMDEIDAALRAERKRRLAAEEAVDVKLAVMRNEELPARDRSAAAEWVFDGRAPLPTAPDQENSEENYYVEQWDAAAG